MSASTHSELHSLLFPLEERVNNFILVNRDANDITVPYKPFDSRLEAAAILNFLQEISDDPAQGRTGLRNEDYWDFDLREFISDGLWALFALNLELDIDTPNSADLLPKKALRAIWARAIPFCMNILRAGGPFPTYTFDEMDLDFYDRPVQPGFVPNPLVSTYYPEATRKPRGPYPDGYAPVEYDNFQVWRDPVPPPFVMPPVPNAYPVEGDTTYFPPSTNPYHHSPLYQRDPRPVSATVDNGGYTDEAGYIYAPSTVAIQQAQPMGPYRPEMFDRGPYSNEFGDAFN